jgi:hypothetical protein
MHKVECLEDNNKNFRKVTDFRKERNKITKQQEIKKLAEECKVLINISTNRKT